MDQKLKQYMEGYIEEKRNILKKTYIRGMIDEEDILGAIEDFRQDVLSEKRRVEPKDSSDDRKTHDPMQWLNDEYELDDMIHLPRRNPYPEDIERLYIPYMNQYLKPFVAWMESKLPEEFDPDGEEGRSYTFSAEETNSCVSDFDHQMVHECRLWIYDRLDVTPEEIKDHMEEIHFKSLPEELPFEKIVTGKDTNRAGGNIIPIAFGTNQLFGDPVFRKKGRIYHCVGKIEGYRPFEGLCTYYGDKDREMEIYTLLDEEKDHPRWNDFYKWKKIREEDYRDRVRKWVEWLIK